MSLELAPAAGPPRAAVVQQSGDRVDLKLELTQSQVGTLLARSLPAGR